MPKFMNIDLMGNLEKIMRINTRSYQSDFEWDRETLMDAAEKADTVPLRDRSLRNLVCERKGCVFRTRLRA